MHSWIASVSLLAFSPFAAAQSVVFQDGFESGLTNWTATGQWDHELSTDLCGGLAAPFPDGNAAAWWGNPSTCDFDNGQANGGMLTLNNVVALPSNVASASLYFQSWTASTAGRPGTIAQSS